MATVSSALTTICNIVMFIFYIDLFQICDKIQIFFLSFFFLLFLLYDTLQRQNPRDDKLFLFVNYYLVIRLYLKVPENFLLFLNKYYFYHFWKSVLLSSLLFTTFLLCVLRSSSVTVINIILLVDKVYNTQKFSQSCPELIRSEII